MTDRTCSIDGCARGHYSKGLCKRHYAAARRKAGLEKRTYVCDWCKSEFRAERKNGQSGYYCSHDCYAESLRDAPSSAIRVVDCSGCGEPFVAHGPGMAHRRYCSRSCRPHSYEPRSRDEQCDTCGSTFVAKQGPARYCSRDCYRQSDGYKRQRARNKAARRARKRLAQRAKYDPQDIYERDGWRCQLCGRKVRRDVRHLHAQAPTIDHIIPLGPDGPDSPENVQTAHRLCNSIKGATGAGQLRLIA